jgi:predicted HicB family RNase H-like nuclease
MLTYKGYSAHCEIDFEAGIIFGRVSGIRNVVTFKGQNVEEAKQAFYESIDCYIEFCQELGARDERKSCDHSHLSGSEDD